MRHNIFKTDTSSDNAMLLIGCPLADECIIVLKGVVDRYQNAGLTAEELERASDAGVFLDGFVESVTVRTD